DLQGEIRIAAGRSMQLEHRWTRKAELQRVDEQPADVVGLERADAQPADAILGETERGRLLDRSPTRQQQERRGHPPAGERADARRGYVEPLDVVDRQHRRLRSREPLEHRKECAGAGETIGRGVVGGSPEQGNLERPALYLGELRQNVVEPVAEQVAEANE